jgi:pimeloyl-ACP methyl ester carboxylesterase
VIHDAPLVVTTQVPTLVLHGDQDASAPIELTGRKTAALLGSATLRVYPGAGHGLYASDHEAINTDILTFIGGTGDGQPPACS